MIIHFDYLMFTVSILQVASTTGRQVKDLLMTGDIGSLLDRQIAIDIIYDLAGRRRLVTKDDITDKYRTFWVQTDRLGLPFVRDPETGHKYLVKYSRTSKGVDLYRITKGRYGAPVVADWATMTVNRIKLNRHGEVELIPIKGEMSSSKFGWLN
ncbi:uncharacterized protein LOC124364102 isoform X1 [Homalodisca vitripennis]|uniref:uncharacterized protein LOC124364102 isoform X1 n=2 Tax=Homalodisca vitripennis TaxID=197043 RepID=UPI001EEB48C0|nr:uncharacterized protein LOC124364102 isoform X1 [Homalodisca vitripennis]